MQQQHMEPADCLYPRIHQEEDCQLLCQATPGHRPGSPECRQCPDTEIQRRRGDSLMTRLLSELKGMQAGGADGGLKEVNAIVGEAALRKKPEARQLYLETELVKNRSNTELFQFLERLLNLLRPSP